MIGIGILGSGGRMGTAIAAAIEERPDVKLAGGAGKGDHLGAQALASLVQHIG